MNLSVKNFKTDINKVKWVRTDYAYPLMCESEKTIESLEADNAALKSENTRYEKHNKTLKNELNIWNESPVTEQVRVLKDKVKELEDMLFDYWVYGEHNEVDDRAEKLLKPMLEIDKGKHD